MHLYLENKLNLRTTAILAALIGASAAITPVLAASATPALVASTPGVALIQKLSNGQAHILKEFKTPIGLDGYAVQMGPGRNIIMFTTQDGKYMLIGGLFDATGKNYSMAYAGKYLPPPPPPPSAKTNYAALNAAHTFLWGKTSAKKELWLIFDPDCIFCHKTWDSIRPYVEKGEVKVHVIPVGFLKPDSAAKAAAIVGAADQAKALAEDETGFNDQTEEGGIKGDPSDAKAMKIVEENNAWMREHGITGTPYILYKDGNGAPNMVGGMPLDMAVFVKGLKAGT
jgi:thiol:disulfide interchange protein DsbG